MIQHVGLWKRMDEQLQPTQFTENERAKDKQPGPSIEPKLPARSPARQSAAPPNPIIGRNPPGANGLSCVVHKCSHLCGGGGTSDDEVTVGV